jgi:RNA polymerase sigma-70 factor (ECF subfamily)
MPGSRRREALLFEELVARHLDLAYHVACTWTTSLTEAEDLVQDAVLKAWRAFARFRAGTNFKAWLLSIMRNAFLDRCREAARPAPASLAEISSGAEPSDPVPSPRAVDLENREVFYDVFGDQVADLLRRMPSEYQVPVLLCDVEGLSYAEIAAALGLRPGTVRSRIHRGRALLAERLRDYARSLGYLKGATR